MEYEDLWQVKTRMAFWGNSLGYQIYRRIKNSVEGGRKHR